MLSEAVIERYKQKSTLIFIFSPYPPTTEAL